MKWDPAVRNDSYIVVTIEDEVAIFADFAKIYMDSCCAGKAEKRVSAWLRSPKMSR